MSTLLLVSFKIHTGQFLKIKSFPLNWNTPQAVNKGSQKHQAATKEMEQKFLSAGPLHIGIKSNWVVSFFANDQQQVGSKATLNQRRELWKPYLRFAAPKLFSPLQFLALEGEMSAFQEQAWQLEYITAPQALSRLILFLSLLDQETKISQRYMANCNQSHKYRNTIP